MPRSRLVTRAENAIDSSPWAVPGMLVGAYALTRLPLGMLTGLMVGFVAGWTLRAEQGSGGRARHSWSRDEDSTVQPEDEKVDAMVDDSFPASDPPSYTPTRAGKPKS